MFSSIFSAWSLRKIKGLSCVALRYVRQPELLRLPSRQGRINKT